MYDIPLGHFIVSQNLEKFSKKPTNSVLYMKSSTSFLQSANSVSIPILFRKIRFYNPCSWLYTRGSVSDIIGCMNKESIKVHPTIFNEYESPRPIWSPLYFIWCSHHNGRVVSCHFLQNSYIRWRRHQIAFLYG